MIASWRFPGPFEGVGQLQLDQVCELADTGHYRAHHLADNWIGEAIAQVLNLGPVDDAKRIKAILKNWVKTGDLKQVMGLDSKRNKRPFIVPRDFEGEAGEG